MNHGAAPLPSASPGIPELAALLADLGLPLPPGPPAGADGGEDEVRCPVLDWARSGAMFLTGPADGPPCWPDGPVVARAQAAALLAAAYGRGAAGGRAGGGRTDGGWTDGGWTDGGRATVRSLADVGSILTGRAADRGFHRAGRRSAGGRCRLFPAADGWVAVSLARASDEEAVPAIVAGLPALPIGDLPALPIAGPPTPSIAGPGGEAQPWERLGRAAITARAGDLAARAQLVGVPAAALPRRSLTPAGRGWRPPVVAERLGAPASPDARWPGRAGPLVVDLTAMWAGPLCASLVGSWPAARVVKVEDARRPDRAREGDPRLFDRLHTGHDSVVLDFGTEAGRAALRALVDGADVVLESSRPRALQQLGVEAGRFVAGRPGRTWVSLTGYGRQGERSGWSAFGDDAAVGGGLVAWDPGGRPVFCADAVADPLSGLMAAVAGLASMTAGGGHLVDVSMSHTAAFMAAGPPCPADHRVVQVGDRWVVQHGDRSEVVAPPRAAAAAGTAHPFGADTSRVLGELAAALPDGAPAQRQPVPHDPAPAP